MTFAVMITTRNRCEVLRRTLSKVATLHPAPNEILICADDCTDGTQKMVRDEFPQCVVIENKERRGSVFSRDRLLRLSKSDILLSLDDDSYPLNEDCFVRLEQMFTTHRDAAVISFPEIRDIPGGSPTKTPHSPPHLVSAYANCSAAMRRDVYLRSAGFPLFFGHMYEEPDYTLQCYALGFVVRFEPGLRIRHQVSQAQREPIRRHHLNARNELWSVLIRCPLPQLLAVAIFRIWRQFRYACSEGLGWAVREPRWWWQAILGFRKCRNIRRPIPWPIYYRWMKLARSAEVGIEAEFVR